MLWDASTAGSLDGFGMNILWWMYAYVRSLFLCVCVFCHSVDSVDRFMIEPFKDTQRQRKKVMDRMDATSDAVRTPRVRVLRVTTHKTRMLYRTHSQTSVPSDYEPRLQLLQTLVPPPQS